MQLNEFSRSIANEMDRQGLSDIIGGSGNTAARCEELFTAVHHLTLAKPDMEVLDFGAGCGRLAVPMMQYLSESGRFVGIDIIPKLVAFANQNISSKYPNCEFFLSGDKNVLYDGFIEGHDRDLLPIKQIEEFDEQSFDIISAFSVFTHLTNVEAAEYLTKLKRLLKPDGKLIISCFLINGSSRKYIRSGKTTIAFSDDVFEQKDVYYFDDILTAVGYEEEAFQKIAIHAGLEPLVTYHGHWCGRPIRHFYQDILVFSPEPEIPKDFDYEAYLKANADIEVPKGAKRRDVAVDHYLQYGISEGRNWK